MLAFFLSTVLHAAAPVAPINANPRTGVAVEGVDVVGYFAEGAVLTGSPDHTTTHAGATWHFATAEHRDTFAADPERYTPQYGGYCAWAVGHGYTAKIDPAAWSIVDGRLYLNYSPRIQKKWMADQTNQIASADQNWPGLHATPTP